MGGAGTQARGCSDVSAVGDIGVNVMSFLSPDKCWDYTFKQLL